MSSHRIRAGFTLIELLVVIAIIAILAAILFPVFAKAREKARQASCTSNEKQIGLAFIQYNQDYDEKMPCGIQGGLAQYYTDYLGIGWAAEIYPYAKSTGLFKCPDDSTAVNGLAVPVSYAANTNLLITGLGNGWQGNLSGTSISAYVQPARTVLLAEISGDQVVVTDPLEAGSTRLSSTTDGAFIWSTTPGSTSVTNSSETIEYGRLSNATEVTATTVDAANPLGWHTNGAEYLCADGHVKWTVPGQVSAGVTNPHANGLPTTTGVYRTGGPFCEATSVGVHALTFCPN